MSFEMAKALRKGSLFVKSRQGHVQAQESGIFLAMTVEQNGVQISQPKMLVENSETGFEPGRTLLRSTRAFKAELATQHRHDREAYTEGKSAFVAAVVESPNPWIKATSCQTLEGER